MKRVALLLVVGLIQIVGEVTDIPFLRSTGLATGASPSPRILATHGGMDPFSCQWQLRWLTVDGLWGQAELNKERWAKLIAPAQKKATIVETFTNAPLLAANCGTRQMFFSTLRYHFSSENSLIHQMGLERKPIMKAELIIVPRQNQKHKPMRFEVINDVV